MRHHPEIVKVVDSNRLIDSESYEHFYWTTRRLPLETGYYIVSWPDHVLRPRFDESADFAGPFRTSAHARIVFDQRVALPYRKSA